LKEVRVKGAPAYSTRRRALAGAFFRSGATVTACVALTLIVIVAVASGLATVMSINFLIYQHNVALQEDSGPRSLILDATARMVAAASTHSVSLFVLAVLPPLFAAYAFERYGRRLTARSDDEAKAADTGRPALLLLRSFDEDRSKLPATLSRRRLVERIVPINKRGFEETVANALARYGPIIAVSPPGVRLPALGAAKMSLPHDNWQQRVRNEAEDALAVVMMATPSAIRPGYQWEIDLAGWSLPHARLILIIGPYHQKEISRRWKNFGTAAAPYPRFKEPLSHNLIPGTHILARSSDKSWTAYGARSRTEISYITCIRSAVENCLERWNSEASYQHPTQP
jgi:hypothetical protein